MIALQIKVKVDEQGNLTAQAPREIPPGEHQAVLVIEAKENGKESRKKKKIMEDFPTIDIGVLPKDLSLRREDLYDDWGR